MDYLNRLEKVIEKGTQDIPSREEMLRIFSALVSAIQTLKDDFLKSNYDHVLNNLRSERTSIGRDVENAKIQFKKDMEQRERKWEQKIQDAIDMIPIPPTQTEVADEVLRKLPPPELAQNGDEIVEKINEEATDKKIKKSRIEGIEELEKIAQAKVIYAGGGSGGGGRFVKSYDLSSSLNGSTKTFTLPAFYQVLSVHLSSFPNILRPTTDYTTSSSASTITFTSEIAAATSLASGQTLLVMYSEP